MRNLAELNVTVDEKCFPLRPPSADEVEEFEERFGLILPPEYNSFLRVVNGGHPELDWVRPQAGRADAGWAVNEFLFLTDDRDSYYGVWKQMETIRTILGEKAIPFAMDSFGNIMFLDLTTTPACVRGCWRDSRNLVVDIAPTFEAFIAALAVDPEAI